VDIQRCKHTLQKRRVNQATQANSALYPSVDRHKEYRQWLGHHKGRNSEFCETAGPVTRIAGTPTQ